MGPSMLAIMDQCMIHACMHTYIHARKIAIMDECMTHAYTHPCMHMYIHAKDHFMTCCSSLRSFLAVLRSRYLCACVRQEGRSSASDGVGTEGRTASERERGRARGTDT